MNEPIDYTIQYAEKLGIDLFAEYSAAAAASKLRVGVNRLRAAANDSELPSIKVTEKKRVYLGLDLIQWKLSKRTGLANTTLPKTEMATGAGLGTANKPSSESLIVLAQETFQRPSKH